MMQSMINTEQKIIKPLIKCCMHAGKAGQWKCCVHADKKYMLLYVAIKEAIKFIACRQKITAS